MKNQNIILLCISVLFSAGLIYFIYKETRDKPVQPSSVSSSNVNKPVNNPSLPSKLPITSPVEYGSSYMSDCTNVFSVDSGGYNTINQACLNCTSTSYGQDLEANVVAYCSTEKELESSGSGSDDTNEDTGSGSGSGSEDTNEDTGSGSDEIKMVDESIKGGFAGMNQKEYFSYFSDNKKISILSVLTMILILIIIVGIIYFIYKKMHKKKL